jgi:UDP-glucose 4-epimerase
MIKNMLNKIILASKDIKHVFKFTWSKQCVSIAVIQLAAQITTADIAMLHGSKREGDPAVLTADAGKFMSVSAWKSKFNLEDMIRHAWAWYNR